MKNLIRPFLIGSAFIYSVNLLAGEKGIVIETNLSNSSYQNLQDTDFIKNYIVGNEVAYLYTKPNLASKTKIKIPNNVGITTIKKSGNLEYGSFNVSSTKSYKGWFLISDLKSIMFTPPKVD